MEESEDLEVGFTNEEEVFEGVFEERKDRLVKRCEIESEILRVELERREGVRFIALEVGWPGVREIETGTVARIQVNVFLSTVAEE